MNVNSLFTVLIACRGCLLCISEPMWPIEARNAAIANSYFTAAINRVGTVSDVGVEIRPVHSLVYIRNTLNASSRPGMENQVSCLRQCCL